MGEISLSQILKSTNVFFKTHKKPGFFSHFFFTPKFKIMCIEENVKVPMFCATQLRELQKNGDI